MDRSYYIRIAAGNKLYPGITAACETMINNVFHLILFLDCSHHVTVHCHRAVVETILRKV